MFAIIRKTSPARAIKWFATERGAKISLAAMNRKAGNDEFKVVSEAERAAADHKVLVRNLLSGKLVEINESDLGSCVDPSTERYHCM